MDAIYIPNPYTDNSKFVDISEAKLVHLLRERMKLQSLYDRGDLDTNRILRIIAAVEEHKDWIVNLRQLYYDTSTAGTIH